MLEVIGQVPPRHIFLDEALSHRAYEDTSLPIGHGQTLSQPYIVARMTELLLAHAPQRVLELGGPAPATRRPCFRNCSPPRSTVLSVSARSRIAPGTGCAS